MRPAVASPINALLLLISSFGITAFEIFFSTTVNVSSRVPFHPKEN
jgi:hypothetical protein